MVSSRSSAFAVLMVGLVLHNCIYSRCLSVEHVRSLFDKSFCIVGTLTTMQPGKILLRSSETEANPFADSSTEIHNNYDAPSEKSMEKGSLSLIHELAAFNAIDYYYYLIGEQGPAHKKTFEIELHLGDEKYTGQGSSIKMAKTFAAQVALEETRYAMPPEKVSGVDPPVLTPTVQLNNLATKLGMKVTYVMHNEGLDNSEFLEDQSNHNKYNIEIGSGKSYLSRLNHSIYQPPEETRTKIANGEAPVPPFSVVVYVGDKEYFGSGYTIQAARHAAAANAIKSLSKLSQKEVEHCLAEGGTCNSDNIKSPTSVVYEEAQKQNLPVEFTIISESGPAHEKVFVTKCQVGDLVTEGEGKSKKASKKNASEKMLKKLEQIYGITNSASDLPAVSKKRKSRKKNKDVIRSAVHKVSRDAQNLITSAFEYFAHGDTKDGNVRKFGSGKDDANDPKETLLGLMQQKGVPVNYLDLFKTTLVHYSLLSLGIHPQHLCLGEGVSFEDAHRNASLRALKFLHKFGFNNITPNKDEFQYIEGVDLQYLEVAKDGFLEEKS